MEAAGPTGPAGWLGGMAGTVENFVDFSSRFWLLGDFWNGRLAQLVRALVSHTRGHWFESSSVHQATPVQEVAFARGIATNASSIFLNLAVSFNGGGVSDFRNFELHDHPTAWVLALCVSAPSDQQAVDATAIYGTR